MAWCVCVLVPGGLPASSIVEELVAARVVVVPGSLFTTRGLQVRHAYGTMYKRFLLTWRSASPHMSAHNRTRQFAAAKRNEATQMCEGVLTKQYTREPLNQLEGGWGLGSAGCDCIGP